MKNKGTALMGIGIANGPNRAIEAARKAIRSPLLEIDISGATDAIVFVTSDIDITMQEMFDINNEIRNASSPDIDIVMGTGFNVDLEGELIVTVIATGFDSENKDESLPFDVQGDLGIDDTAGTKTERQSGESIPDWLKSRFK